MAAEIKTKITAENDTNAAFDDARKSVSGFEGAVKSGVEGLKSFTAGFQDIRAGIGMAQDALGQINQVYQATVGEALNFANQTSNLSRTLGVNASESSKLILITKTMGIQYETLNQSINQAMTQGVRPSIADIQKLADKYVAAKDPIDRAKIAASAFGQEGGPKMAAILALGSDGISKLTAEAEKSGAVMDDKSVGAAKKYEKQIASLTNQFDAMKVKTGNEVIPALSGFIDVLNNSNKDIEDNKLTWTTYIPVLNGVTDAFFAVKNAIKQVSSGADEAKKSIDNLTAAEAAFNNGGQYHKTAITNGKQGYNYITQTPTRASGGPVWAGIPSGFNSEETFVPKTNGWILPAGAGGESSVTNNQGGDIIFQISGNDPHAIASEVESTIRRMKRSGQL